MKYLIDFIKGIVVGATTSVPGVSGGTMALILGIYDKIIHSMSKLFKNFKVNGLFLGVVGIGMVLGLVLAAPFVEFAIDNYKYPALYFFIGIVFAGVPVLLKKANQGKKKKTDIIFFIIGSLIIGALLLFEYFYKGELFNLSGGLNLVDIIILFVSGIIIAIALILPGISTSFLLVVLGLYKPLIEAVKTKNMGFLLPVVIGTIFGTFATTGILEKLMNEKPRQTYLMILGFVAVSVVQVFPGIPTGINILYSIIAFIFGYILIYFMIKKQKNLD